MLGAGTKDDSATVYEGACGVTGLVVCGAVQVGPRFVVGGIAAVRDDGR